VNEMVEDFFTEKKMMFEI